MNTDIAVSKRRLLTFDFDGTVADTFTKSPNGMCVELACAQAIKAMFGEEGQEAFHSVGGLLNRAPGELIRVISERLDQQVCARSALEHLEDKFWQLHVLMPQGKGLPLRWNAKAPHDIMTEIFVRTKLGILFAEVGAQFPDSVGWPRPMDGLQEFLRAIDEANASRREGEKPVQIAILSSGHDEFVKRCFRMWECSEPAVIVTDDDLRPMTRLRPERRSKPSNYLMWILLKTWAKKESGMNGSFHFNRRAYEARKREVVYFGDDNVRDGDLARNNGVPFFLFDPQGRVQGAPKKGTTIIRSWHTLAEHVRERGLSVFG